MEYGYFDGLMRITGITAGQGSGPLPVAPRPIHVEETISAEPSARAVFPVTQSNQTADSFPHREPPEPQSREPVKSAEGIQSAGPVDIVDIPIPREKNTPRGVAEHVPPVPVENLLEKKPDVLTGVRPPTAAPPAPRETPLHPPPSQSPPGESPGIGEKVEFVELTPGSPPRVSAPEAGKPVGALTVVTPPPPTTPNPGETGETGAIPAVKPGTKPGNLFAEVRRWVAEPTPESPTPAISPVPAEPTEPTVQSAPSAPVSPGPVQENREFSLSIGSINVTVEDPPGAADYPPPPPPQQNRQRSSPGGESLSSRLGRHYIRMRE